VKLHEQSDRSWTECELELLGFTHADLSAEALEKWKFPQEVQLAVRDHHHPPPFQADGTIQLSAVIHAANQYVNSTGESIVASKLVAAEDAGAIAALGIPEEKIGPLLMDFKAEHAAMIGFFK
jgi:HD-like signal output (HDOD) protein